MTLADAIGIDALTIRKLATAMGTKPMSIYRHVPSKDEISTGWSTEPSPRSIDPRPTKTGWMHSDNVACLAAGKGCRVNDAREQTLKGITEPARLWELDWKAVLPA